MLSVLVDSGRTLVAGIDYAAPSTWAAIAFVLMATFYLLMRTGFDMIEQICNRTYIYNICWEDPAVDHEIMNIEEEDVIFRICSAGDIVLDYAIEGPSKIVVCDMNQHQLFLFELKVRMLRDPNLTYDEWWAIWGSSDADVATAVWKRIRHTMSGDGRKWWDPRIDRTFRKGFAKSGSTGFVSKWVISLFWLGGFNVKEWASTGFSHEYIVKNSKILERAAFFFRILFPTILAPFAGVPKNQLGEEFYTVEFYENILREIFLDPEFGSKNYFYRFYTEGGYKDQTCCPRTLQKEHFQKLKQNSGCFEWHHATVQETMERVKPNTFTKLVLLDHMDWMPNRMVHDEWVALQRATRPGSLVLWRSAFTKMDDKPFFNNLDITDLSPQYYPKDRVKTYPGTFKTNMPIEPLPWVDEELSPCQKASVVRKAKTTAKMILHPLTGGKINGHGDKMSAFYAQQALGYDAVRESMLVARPDMMTSFGPIKEGHTWLDVGGGTGRNLHYLRAQLDRFQRVVVLDICKELLDIGEVNARKSFTPSQCERISWVCLDINVPEVRSKLAVVMDNDLKRGFDTITFSYSLSMIPRWEEALLSAKSLMSPEGRVIVADFDTFTENGRSVSDFILRNWYHQDGVRIEAKTREVITKNVFPRSDFTLHMTRFQRTLLGVTIPHMVVCCKQQTETNTLGYRRNSSLANILKSKEQAEEKKME